VGFEQIIKMYFETATAGGVCGGTAWNGEREVAPN